MEVSKSGLGADFGVSARERVGLSKDLVFSIRDLLLGWVEPPRTVSDEKSGLGTGRGDDVSGELCFSLEPELEIE